MQAYSVEKVVGEGSFGKALLCRRNVDKKRVIVKQISISRMSAKEAQRTELEATLLSRLKHPNIVAFIDSFKSANHLHIVMEYADGGDLDSHIKKRRGKLLSEEEVLHMFVQIALALKHIHDRKILHRDLKSQNIFLTLQGYVKLGDFGVSRVLERTVDLAATQVGTPYYMPPEICNGTKYNSKCDIWSLGVILFELMTLSLPFKGSNMQQLVRNITSQPVPAVSTSLYTSEFRKVLDAMLCKTQARRPGINAVLNTPVIQKRIAHLLDENVKQQEFSHTVLHGAHILKGRMAPNPSSQGMPPAIPSAALPIKASPPQLPSPQFNIRVASPAAPGLVGPREREKQRERDLERERQLKGREDAKKLQRAAEERREKERERERAQAAAIQALRDAQREKEKYRERDIERARERLAAEKRALELAKVRAADRESELAKEKEKARIVRAEAEREKLKVVERARENALRDKAAEAEKQLRARRDRDLKLLQEQKGASPPSIAPSKLLADKKSPSDGNSAAAALAARRQANLEAFERAKEEQTKLARARLRNQMAARPSPSHSPASVAMTPSPSPSQLAGKPKSIQTPKVPESSDAKLVRGLKKFDYHDDTDSSEERDLQRLGPPPPKIQKPVSISALEELGVGNQWLSELEQRMGHLKVSVFPSSRLTPSILTLIISPLFTFSYTGSSQANASKFP